MNGTLSKQELREYADGTLTDIFIERAFDEQLHRGKSGNANAREMDFETFLDFVLALENKDSPEGTTYLFKCLDLNGRVFLTTTDIHTLQETEDVTDTEAITTCNFSAYVFLALDKDMNGT
ncbi:probable serine/threonine-protein phosphatase 2A regulatory subunit B'' subunit TON2 [Tanacetum coccineum]